MQASVVVNLEKQRMRLIERCRAPTAFVARKSTVSADSALTGLLSNQAMRIYGNHFSSASLGCYGFSRFGRSHCLCCLKELREPFGKSGATSGEPQIEKSEEL